MGSVSLSEREAAAAFAITQVGVPFHFQQATPGVALDCVGLVIATAQSVGAFIADKIRYTLHDSQSRRSYVTARESLNEICPDDAGVGDVLLFWIRRPDWPMHMGVIVNDEKFAHATPAQARVMLVSRASPMWVPRVFAAFRFRCDAAAEHELTVHPLFKDVVDSTRGYNRSGNCRCNRRRVRG